MTMNIGIVGGGIAGLSAAWLLREAGQRVTVFESQPVLGIDAHALDLEIDRHSARVDVPSRMFNDSLWSNLVKLYEHAGVQFEPVDATQSFGRHGQETFLNTRLPYRKRLDFKRILDGRIRQVSNDIVRLKREGPIDLQQCQPLDVTLGEYLRAGKYSDIFVQQFLYPVLSSTVCTCSTSSIDAYPAAIILEAMQKLTGSRPLLRTSRGSLDVAMQLARDVDEIRLSTVVQSVTPEASAVRVVFADESGRQRETHFDHVVLATQANRGLGLLTQPSELERRMLRSFGYEETSVIVHTDASLMPVDRSRWSTFNMMTENDPPATMCTVWMNRFYSNWEIPVPVFQTIRPLADPAPDKVFSRTVLQRPVVNQSSIEGWKLLEQLHDEPGRRIWFSGSYASYGVPLLESAVVSSIRIARCLGIQIWEDLSYSATR